MLGHGLPASEYQHPFKNYLSNFHGEDQQVANDLFKRANAYALNGENPAVVFAAEIIKLINEQFNEKNKYKYILFVPEPQKYPENIALILRNIPTDACVLDLRRLSGKIKNMSGSSNGIQNIKNFLTSIPRHITTVDLSGCFLEVFLINK